MRLAALILAAFLLVGCSPWVVKVEPVSLTLDRGPIVKKAIRVPEGDLEHLAQAEGKVIGRMAVDVNTGWALTGGLEEVHEKAGLPRTRGDAPLSRRKTRPPSLAAPHSRGCARMFIDTGVSGHYLGLHGEEVGPAAHAGRP